MGMEQVRLEPDEVTPVVSPLVLLKQRMESWGEQDSSHIISDLMAKERAGELTLAFCGHFSAGKSSMINALCGKPVLPSGPVPTSANIVSIRSGNPRVLLHPQTGADGSSRPTVETTPDLLKDYCRQGADYSAIEVWEEVPLLGDSGVLMDTPGVDSTDEGHQAATHSALHLADAVFYVMDYNHVQSENNLAFAKSLSDWGKPLYLIINQIDKHREREISIEEYRQQVESAFREWGIHSAGLLFTSLKVKDHPLNQWGELLELIKGLLEQHKELLEYSLSRSIHHTAAAVLAAYREAQQEERSQLLEETGGAGEEAAASALREISEEEERLLRLPEHSRLELRSRLDALLGNSNLMPADVRDAGGAYIESASPGFRRGLLFTAAKREKEQAARLLHWHGLLSREVTAQLEWHLIQLVRDWAEGLGVWQEGAEPSLKQAFPAVGQQWLADQIKPGTGFAGEALLNFCRSLAAEIKAQFRRAVLAFGEGLLEALPPLLAAQQAELADRAAALQRQVRAHARLAALDRAACARADELAALLPPRRTLAPGVLPGVRAVQAGAPGAASPEPPRSAAASPAAAQEWAAGMAQPAGGRRRLTQAAGALHAAAELLRGEPAMASAARSLAARADDLAGGRFTMALFGAFSAGKSSFANALLGEEVLPVSPHPATAAVGRILAPEGEFTHGTAVITMKRAEDFWEDILHSFSVLQLTPPQHRTWTAAVAQLRTSGLHPSALPHAGFLRAAAAGWEESGPLLGTECTVSLEEYRKLVADEKRACFVQSTDLYYDSPLTRSGIVLVDTPGADSLHARHTGVTFGYMKNADAICFVTYYNHAFSKADRSLLAQLGRIKDSFALDKMFFIINASDLASDEAELEEVKQHVAQNLRASGLTSPRIYALSSLLALEGKAQGNRDAYENSRFSSFEAALSEFAGEELPRLSLAAARESLSSVRLRAEEWQQLASMAADQREEGLRRFRQRREAAGLRLAQLETEERPLRDLRREGEELLYHVRQRLAFSFGRSFQESFHPSILREDGGNLKDIFIACGRELERSIQRELEQELWATTLRLEAAGRRLVSTAAESAAAELSIEHLENQDGRWTAPEKLDCRLIPLDWAGLWGRFKSPRHFFEGPGRAEIRTAAEPWFKEAVAAAVQGQEEGLLAFYSGAAAAALAQAAVRLREDLAEREAAMSELLKGGDSAQHWGRIAGEISLLEQSFDELVDSHL